MSAQDELTTTLLDAVKQLSQVEKAGVLLNSALALIELGRYGEEVENYLDVYLETPGLPEEDVTRALLARSDARTICGEGLLARAQQDAQAVLKRDPSNMQARSQLRCKEIRYLNNNPACQRLPTEVWDEIAIYIPRYHLRTWLFVSHLHRGIASRRIFHTIEICFGEQESCNRTLGILDRAKKDPIFASHVKSLQLRWRLQAGNMSNLMINLFKSFLPAFKALRHLEWIGCPEMQAKMVQALHNTPKHLHGVSLILVKSQRISTVCISAFEKLRKFGFLVYTSIDVRLLRTVLDQNECTLKHLVLSEFNISDTAPLDLAFKSVTIENLINLELHTQVSHFMLTRIVSAHDLQSLTLHKTRCMDLDSAAALFASDCIIGGSHTLLPHLAAFRFTLDGQAELALYHSVIHFLRQREKLRRLDLGGCPWNIIKDILPDLRNLRVLACHGFSQKEVRLLLKLIPRQMVAIKLLVNVPDGTFDDVARYTEDFTRFNTLSFLHLQIPPPKPKRGKSDFRVEPPSSIFPTTVPSLDFWAWNDMCYVVVRSHGDGRYNKTLVKRLSSKLDIDCDDAAWLEQYPNDLR